MTKRTRKTRHEAPTADPITAVETLAEAHPALAHTDGDSIEIEHPAPPQYPEKPGENGQAHRAERPVKSWAETVRPWTGPGNTGVELVTTTSRDMIGIPFVRGTKHSPEEKREMEAICLKWWEDAKAWLKPLPPKSRPDDHRAVWEEVEALHGQFHERRQAEQEEGRGRF